MAKREKIGDFLSERKLIVFVVLILGFTIIGPFGTYEVLDLWQRLIFWSLCITAIGIFMNVAVALAITAPTLEIIPRPARITLGAMIAALPSTAVIIFFTAYMFPADVNTSSYPFIWFQIAVIGSLVSLFQFRPKKEPVDEPKPVTTRFHERLPKNERHDIVSLTMRDHYVEVTTTTGRHMVLSRLSDAEVELEGLEGVRLHRSHWAAAKHITGLTKQGRKTLATLSDGRSLPVGKQGIEYVQALVGRRRATDPQ